MVRGRDHTEDTGGAPPLPPLSVLRSDDARWYARPLWPPPQQETGGSVKKAPQPTVRPDVVTRDTKLSLTDTFAMLRTRGRRQLDNSSSSSVRDGVAASETEQRQYTDGNVNRPRSCVSNCSETITEAGMLAQDRLRRDGETKRLPQNSLSSKSMRHHDSDTASQSYGESEFSVREQQRLPLTIPVQRTEDADAQSQLLPPQPNQETAGFGFSLADTLVVSKPRTRRPIMGRDKQVGRKCSSFKSARSEPSLSDENDDDDRPCCVGPEFEITEEMTPEEVRKVKKARRKEQCRVNQANYRRRKRALETQTDQEIQELQTEIEHLQAKRDNARKRARQALDTDLLARDPMNLVQHTFLQLSSVNEVDRRQTRAPRRQVDTIVGLEFEEFASVNELIAQWKYHRTVFDTFELRLRSVRTEQLGDSLVLAAEATLRCSIVARPHKRHKDFGNTESLVVCPVVQRFVFDEHERRLAKIISEVDWLAGLRAHSSSPLALAAELVASSSPTARA